MGSRTTNISGLLSAIRGEGRGFAGKVGSRAWVINHAYRVIRAPVNTRVEVFVVIRTGSKKQSWHRLKDLPAESIEVLRDADAAGAPPIGRGDQIDARRVIRSSLASDCALLKIIYRAWLKSKKAKTKSRQKFDFFAVLKKLPPAKLRELRASWENPIRIVLGLVRADTQYAEYVLPFDAYVEVFIYNVLKIEGAYRDIPTPDTIKRAYISRDSYAVFSKRLHIGGFPTSPLERQIRETIQKGNDVDLEKLFKQVLGKRQ